MPAIVSGKQKKIISTYIALFLRHEMRSFKGLEVHKSRGWCPLCWSACLPLNPIVTQSPKRRPFKKSRKRRRKSVLENRLSPLAALLPFQITWQAVRTPARMTACLVSERLCSVYARRNWWQFAPNFCWHLIDSWHLEIVSKPLLSDWLFARNPNQETRNF